jgi:hypothetical protein
MVLTPKISREMAQPRRDAFAAVKQPAFILVRPFSSEGSANPRICVSRAHLQPAIPWAGPMLALAYSRERAHKLRGRYHRLPAAVSSTCRIALPGLFELGFGFVTSS